MTQPALKRDRGSPDTNRGLVQVFTGDGKGKTTAGLGAAIRALGQGKRVAIVFFMKGGCPSGEMETLRRLPDISCQAFGAAGFIRNGRPGPEDREQAALAWDAACAAVRNPDNDMVVLDEVCLAVSLGLVPLLQLTGLIRGKPAHLDLILTGRRADVELIELADMVTECVKVKHHFDKGIPSRRGVEY